MEFFILEAIYTYQLYMFILKESSSHGVQNLVHFYFKSNVQCNFMENKLLFCKILETFSYITCK